MIIELVKNRSRKQFISSTGNDLTTDFYNGTHEIVLDKDCIEPALRALEQAYPSMEILAHNDDHQWRCCVVVSGMSEKDFFRKIVSVVEKAVSNIYDGDGRYSVRRKIPLAPQLPENSDSAESELISGENCYRATVHLGRGYGHRYSQMDILLTKHTRRVYYRIQRFNNDSASGGVADGEAKLFKGNRAQWLSICYAYGISDSDDDSKEAARRAKNFVYAIVGDLMSKFWGDGQPSCLDAWEEAQAEAMAEV